MLYYLLYPFRDIFFGFNIFRYITFRSIMAAVTAFLFSVIVGPAIIKKLKSLKVSDGNTRLVDCPQLQEKHKDKADTPTMGGIIILAGILIAVLLWADISNVFVLLTLFVCLWLGVLGFIDDFLKLTKKGSKGLRGRTKLLWQILLGVLVGAFLYRDPQFEAYLYIPFLKDAVLNLGLLYIGFVALVIVGSSNAVNLTDGLDGLAIGCTTLVAATMTVLSYVAGNTVFSKYLLIPFVPGAGELTVFCMAIVGAGLGFLWFNCHPAMIFMGDVGSLALGGMLGVIAVFIRKELLLFVMGGIFVAEALSVMIQVASFKSRKKRIFKCAPLHHHFQMAGMPESRVITRFWIVAIVLVLVTLLTLKIR